MAGWKVPGASVTHDMAAVIPPAKAYKRTRPNRFRKEWHQSTRKETATASIMSIKPSLFINASNPDGPLRGGQAGSVHRHADDAYLKGIPFSQISCKFPADFPSPVGLNRHAQVYDFHFCYPRVADNTASQMVPAVGGHSSIRISAE